MEVSSISIITIVLACIIPLPQNISSPFSLCRTIRPRTKCDQGLEFLYQWLALLSPVVFIFLSGELELGGNPEGFIRQVRQTVMSQLLNNSEQELDC